MATDAATLREDGFGETQRRDAWWAGPLVTALVLGGFVVYTTFRIFQNAYFHFGHGTDVFAGAFVFALADVLAAARAAQVGAGVDFAGDVHSVDAGRISIDLLLLSQGVLPGVLFGSAGVCGGRAAGSIQGRDAPALVQNIHRYFLYIALVFIVILGYDAIESYIWPTANGGHTFGVSVGSLVLTTGSDVAGSVHVQLPFVATPGRRKHRLFFVRGRWANAVQDVARCDTAQ